MHLIVTHPNADFDAVASLVGAWWLYPEAIPLLPNTLNRNVRDFVTLYENELPLVRQKELGKEAIDQITLVDTQQMPDLKRLSDDVSLHIIDHHELHQSPTPGTRLSLTDTGATVTMLVEHIRQLPGRISPIEATLFLLGIYEDTGSLTYGNTSPRDLQAAAWLLSEGRARLDIVRKYINYPMSLSQRQLYEQIVDNLETHSIHGQTIIIGQARVEEYVEEISILAHHLRDLYQPDALFILVELVDHVQMVARSITDDIDVGQIAEQMGGGGHPRAAAALIKEKPLVDIHRKLIELLQQIVQPATTVAQVMSRGARTLFPSDTVRYAAKMMDRYGHEGFPVVEEESGQVVGILSRREIDKARRHKLHGAAIAQFMKKGRLAVLPDDSIDAVQDLMVHQQVGQVPVVHPQHGRVIGIVTRTDLINLWQLRREATQEPPSDLIPHLEWIFSPELFQLLQEAGQLAAEQGDTLYVVGGFVRDSLLTMLLDEIPAKISPRTDLDLVVEGDAIALAHRLQKQHQGRVRSHQRFGTAKWILAQPIPFAPGLPGKSGSLTMLDFASSRTEFYRHPSALPEVEQSAIRQDLHRRDFTINTLAVCLSPDRLGELLDFYGGQRDLEARLIRVLHSLSFVDDPTRMLRAARLMARLDFELEERTAELLHNALDLLHRVSGERIFNELELIFREYRPELALQQLQNLGILTTIHPGLMVDEWLTERLRLLREGMAQTPWANIRPLAVHYLGLLFFWLARDELDQLIERLNLRNRQRDILKEVHAIRRKAPQIAKAEENSRLYRLLRPFSEEARLIAWLGLDNETARRQIVRYQQDLQDVEPLIDGHYLKAEMELSPGPIYGDIIEMLRTARLDGEASTLPEERRLVEQFLAENGQK